MEGYLETLGVLAVGVTGAVLGKGFSSLKRPYWLGGYFISMLFISLLVVSRFYYPVNFISPFSYFLAGRSRFVLLCFAVTLGLFTPLERLPLRTERILICVLMGIVIGWFSVLPFLAPPLLRAGHESMQTRISADGVCFQTTDYTCGPAAAVTALGRLGIHADEGRLAVLSHSSPVIGTLPNCLADALSDEYETAGIKCEFRLFDSIDQLSSADVTLAVVKDSLLTDHCVAILEVHKDSVLVGDPVVGKRVIPRDKFAKIWRFSGITINRRLPEKM